MVSDFFYPNTGGVEAHIWQLGQCLMDLGHNVIVITHAYVDREGIHYMSNGLKVYYVPCILYPKQNSKWPLVFPSLAIIRQILLRERIDIVHGHSAFSPMAHEVMFHAKTLSINTVFTDHSLFGSTDFIAMIHNFVVKLSLLQCNHLICVSHIGRQNKALQLKVGRIHDDNIPISVIPNAVDTSVFTPDPSQRNPSKITIVVISRLVYRKGIDLLAAALPKICQLDPKVQFLIAGDGPKRVLLESAINQYNLHDRVRLLGLVPHDQVRNVLVQGDIFLNTSLIEAFCMAIVEAASCGLQVVSTNVGGLPEVLPPNLIKLTEPNVDSLVNGVQSSLEDLRNGRHIPPSEAHKIIENSYSWKDVAKKTEKVYTSVIREQPYSLKQRINRYIKSGSINYIAGGVFIVILLINHLLMLLYDWINPRRFIDECPTWGKNKLHRTQTNGNHGNYIKKDDDHRALDGQSVEILNAISKSHY